MAKTVISTDEAHGPTASYSQGVAVGGFVFTAGMGPLDLTTGTVVGETIAEQTDVVLDHIEGVLRARGLDLSDLVKVTVHLQDPDRDRAGFDAAYRRRVPEPYPVRTTVGSQLDGILVEIDVVAAER